jgi:hypothetical protein
MLFRLSLIHGKLWLETSSLVEEYTSCCTVFKQVPRERQTWIEIDKSGAFRQRPAGT